MYRVHIALSNVNKILIISQVYLLRNNSKSLNHYWIILVHVVCKKRNIMVAKNKDHTRYVAGMLHLLFANFSLELPLIL